MLLTTCMSVSAEGCPCLEQPIVWLLCLLLHLVYVHLLQSSRRRGCLQVACSMRPHHLLGDASMCPDVSCETFREAWSTVSCAVRSDACFSIRLLCPLARQQCWRSWLVYTYAGNLVLLCVQTTVLNSENHTLTGVRRCLRDPCCRVCR